jgi:hypothetical protein
MYWERKHRGTVPFQVYAPELRERDFKLLVRCYDFFWVLRRGSSEGILRGVARGCGGRIALRLARLKVGRRLLGWTFLYL